MLKREDVYYIVVPIVTWVISLLCTYIFNNIFSSTEKMEKLMDICGQPMLLCRIGCGQASIYTAFDPLGDSQFSLWKVYRKER